VKSGLPIPPPHLLNILAALELEAEGKIISVAGQFSKPWLLGRLALEPERILDVIRYQE
jgi:hypothetical protein